MAFSYSPKIVTDGLVLYLDAANPYSYISGSTVWNDISRSQSSGILTNGPTFSSANNGSIVFDGTNDYVDLPHFFDISLGGFTFNTWFNCSNTSWSPIFCDWYNNQWSFNLQIYGGKTDFSFNNSSGTDLRGITYSNGYNIVINTIYNICYTYNPVTKTTSLYVNGNLYSSGSNTNANPYVRNTTNNFGLAIKQDSNNYLSGRIYNHSVYNRALSTQEVQQNYNATKGRFGLT